jgi:hypothetical protein
MSVKTLQNKTAWHSLPAVRLGAMGVTMLLIGLVTALGPPERTLGINIRVVYLHGAWVWTGKLAFGLAALAGLAGLLRPGSRWQLPQWSLALGRTGLLFWLTYLPLSLLVMQVNWGGFFLDEPRWKVSLMFGIVGALLQTALLLLNSPRLTLLTNLLFGVALWLMIAEAPTEMHPVSPIFGSDAFMIQLYFIGLLVLVLLLAAQAALLIRESTRKP